MSWSLGGLRVKNSGANLPNWRETPLREPAQQLRVPIGVRAEPL